MGSDGSSGAVTALHLSEEHFTGENKLPRLGPSVIPGLAVGILRDAFGPAVPSLPHRSG